MPTLRETLEKEREKGFTFEGQDPLQMIDSLIPHIGDPDPVLRDGLVYPALEALSRQESLKPGDYRKLLGHYLGPEYLFHGIETERVKAALRRSFTVLQLCVLVDVHRERPVFTDEDLNRLIDSVIDYYTREPILTGYHQDYGWVHTIAHTADLFEGLFALNTFDPIRMTAALDAIRGRFVEVGMTYAHGEDLRTARALTTGVKSGAIEAGMLESFINGFETARTMGPAHEDVSPEMNVIRRTNAVHLLEGLLVGLLDTDNHERFIGMIRELIRTW